MMKGSYSTVWVVERLRLKEKDLLFPHFPDFEKVLKVIKRIVSKMVVQIKSGNPENGKSFSFNLYRKRSTACVFVNIGGEKHFLK